MAEVDYPKSWYAATRDESRERAPLTTQEEADVAVVGGGFAGLHTARLLARQGQRVVLLERRRIGWGASGRNGGFVGPGYAAAIRRADRRSSGSITRASSMPSRNAALRSCARRSAELGRPDILMGSGKLSLSRTDQGAGFADRTRKLADQLGASFEPWDTRTCAPCWRRTRYHQGIHDPTSFHIHPLNLALALAADIERQGGTRSRGHRGR